MSDVVMDSRIICRIRTYYWNRNKFRFSKVSHDKNLHRFHYQLVMEEVEEIPSRQEKANRKQKTQ
jgi:hypothetical protein